MYLRPAPEPHRVRAVAAVAFGLFTGFTAGVVLGLLAQEQSPRLRALVEPVLGPVDPELPVVKDEADVQGVDE